MLYICITKPLTFKEMKKLLFIFCLCIVFNYSQSQELSFNFTAEHTCEFVALDSVIIQNISQGGDTILYYPDTVLSFVFTGVLDNFYSENDFHVSKNYPNPFNQSTYFDVVIPRDDYLKISVFDISGRLLTTHQKHLSKGEHNFKFSGGKPNTYILSVQSSEYSSNVLMLSYLKSDNNNAKISYKGNSKEKSGVPELKSTLQRQYFPYSIGDELSFNGFVNGNYIEIIDSPVESEFYIFEFNSDLPQVPSEIMGDDSHCINASEILYSVVEDPELDYEWSVPGDWEIVSGQGSSSIVVDIGTESGEISVSVENSCGWGETEILFVTIIPEPIADAGEDQLNLPGTSVTLDANNPEYGTGEWSGGAGGTFSDINDPNAIFSGQAGEEYTLTWTLTNMCGTDDDNITISFAEEGEFVCGQLLEYEGYSYKTALIGEQCWFAENLRYDNGCSQVSWQENTDVGWCGPYNNESSYIDDFGLLYQWSAVMSGSTEEGAQGLCPPGWRIPTHSDWTDLEREVCTSATCETDFPYDNTTTGHRGTNEGSKLAGTNLWDPGDLTSNPEFNSESDFRGEPAGLRLPFEFMGSSFGFAGIDSRWWSSTSEGSEVWQRGLDFQNSTVYRGKQTKDWAFSVRCVK